MNKSNLLKKAIGFWILLIIPFVFLGCVEENENGIQLGFSNGISAPDGVYYGDTITLMMSTINPSVRYEVFFSHTDAKIVSVNSGRLKFIIPDAISEFDPEDMVTIQLLHEGQTDVLERKIKFKDPVFLTMEVLPTDFADMIRIKGKYLHDPYLSLYYWTDSSSATFLPIEFAGESELVFKPTVTFNTLNPEFILAIRDKTYKLKNLVKFKPTSVDEDQQLELEIGNLNSSITITGQNLNPYGTDLVITPDFLDWKVVEGGKDFIKIGFNGFKDFIPENFKVQIKMAGGALSNPVNVKVISPIVSQQKFDLNPIFSGLPTVVEGKILFYSYGLFWELNPRTGDLKKVWGNESLFFGGASFVQLVGKKLFYFAIPDLKMSAFDTETYEMEDLGEVGGIRLPFRVYELNGKLRLENGYIPLEKDSLIFKSILQEFDPVNRTWTILREGEDIVVSKVVLPTNVFSHQNQLYNISWDISKPGDEQNYLFRLNPIDQSWEKLGVLTGDFQEYNAFEVHSVNGRLFFNSWQNWYELEINTLTTRRLDQLSSFVSHPIHFSERPKGFVIGNKFYISRSLMENEVLLLEIDTDSL